jgi:organic hydroperoxide reductase OsmC/OhrA
MNTFPLSLHWTGSTAADYSRAATARAPGKPDIALSAGPTYSGDPARWNPEDLFGAAVSMCHMLTFLALAKKVRLDVTSYVEDATVFLDVVEGVTKVTRVRLAPTITLAAGSDADKAREMFDKAHKYCFVANSITSEVVMEPNVVLAT